MARIFFIISFLLLTLSIFISSFFWFSSDAIGRANLESKLFLALTTIRGYEKSATSLEHYRGEAPRHQTMINVATWCIQNPKKANFLLAEFDKSTIDSLSLAAIDSGLEKEWQDTIRGLNLK